MSFLLLSKAILIGDNLNIKIIMILKIKITFSTIIGKRKEITGITHKQE